MYKLAALGIALAFFSVPASCAEDMNPVRHDRMELERDLAARNHLRGSSLNQSIAPMSPRFHGLHLQSFSGRV